MCACVLSMLDARFTQSFIFGNALNNVFYVLCTTMNLGLYCFAHILVFLVLVLALWTCSHSFLARFLSAVYYYELRALLFCSYLCLFLFLVLVLWTCNHYFLAILSKMFLSAVYFKLKALLF